MKNSRNKRKRKVESKLALIQLNKADPSKLL